MKKLELQELNALDQQQFVMVLSSLFEGHPWIISQSWYSRPFGDLAYLHQVLCRVMSDASSEQQIALLRAHPDLAGRVALTGMLTSSSRSEQASAGLDRLSQDEIVTFDRLNKAYRDKFGFPFVICARENQKESILAAFSARLENSREREIEIALGEVSKICWYRLQDIVRQEGMRHK